MEEASAHQGGAAGQIPRMPDRPPVSPGRTGAPHDDRPESRRPAPASGPAGGAHPVPAVLTVIAVLLTIGAAATDVASFTRLGSVFASVMTSNIVFLGLAAARGSATLAWHAAVSFAGYVAGVALGSRLARTGQRRAGWGEMTWSPWIAAALIAEVVAFTGFTVGWELTGAKPVGADQLVLLAVATLAMGMQSAVVVAIGISGVSTTYMTGTLTTLIDAIASPGPSKGTDVRRPIVLLALAAGAGLSGLLIATAPAAVPLVPLAMVLAALGVGSGPLRRFHRHRPG